MPEFLERAGRLLYFFRSRISRCHFPLSLGASSPWLRTLALPTGPVAVPLLAAPAAYGLEIYTPEALQKPLRPGFALLSPAQYALAAKATPLTQHALI